MYACVGVHSGGRVDLGKDQPGEGPRDLGPYAATIDHIIAAPATDTHGAHGALA